MNTIHLKPRRSGRLHKAKRPPALRLVLESLEARVTPTRFAVIGEYGLQGSPELSVSNLVKSLKPDFILTAGDNNYQTGSAHLLDANIGQFYHGYIGQH